jgi:hypothetical protein
MMCLAVVELALVPQVTTKVNQWSTRIGGTVTCNLPSG